MTIRKYLFLLISTLLLLIAIVQVSLIFFFKGNIEQEVERRGKLAANRILNIAIENIENEDVHIIQDANSNSLPSNSTKVKRKKDNMLIEVFAIDDSQPIFVLDVTKNEIKKNDFDHILQDLPDEIKNEVLQLANSFSALDSKQLKNTVNGFTIEISSDPKVEKRLLAKHLKKQITRMHRPGHEKSRSQDTTLVEQRIKLNTLSEQKFSILDPKTRKDIHVVNKFSYLMIATILLTTLIAFVFVYIFSKRFSEPLKQLADGFKELEKGELGQQVKAEGVEEVKRTINSFNNMSLRLVELARAEKQMQQHQQLTEISDISKGIAHALRNPIHTIGLAVEQLEADELPSKLKSKLIKRVRNKIDQLDKNIKVLLTITSGEIDREQYVNFTSVINDVLLELRQSHDNHLAELNIKLTLDDSLKLKASNTELRTVFHTLIYNAYEASLEKLIAKSDNKLARMIDISISTYKENENAIIAISDSGHGIKPEIESSLFQPHISTKSEGAGMGLYISKRIIEIYYQGSISVSNQLVNEQVIGAQANCSFPLTSNNSSSNKA